MRPSLIYELLDLDNTLRVILGGTGRIREAQSVDERWVDTGHMVTLNMAEMDMRSIGKGPRTLEVNVHKPWDIDRDYTSIDGILSRIDYLLLPVENEYGSDNVRVSQIRRIGRSGNDVDEAWRTITRQATFGVLWDEYPL